MKNKIPILAFILICLVLAGGFIFKGIGKRDRSHQVDKSAYLRINRSAGPIMRGFQYSTYHEGQKAFSIKAAKFSVEKKKIGIFQLSPFKVARLKDAEIDFYAKSADSDEKMNQPSDPNAGRDDIMRGGRDVSFKGILTQEMLPSAELRGSVSAICEPIRINLYLDDASKPVTRIQAEEAVVDPRRRRMILRNNIIVTSGALNLSTDNLAIYPDTGLLEAENKYVLKSQNETVTGEKLTTDLFLKRVSTQ
jgi:hypothetical protein